MSAKSLIALSFEMVETASGLGAGADGVSSFPHRMFRRESYSNGTGTGQADIAWSDRLTVTSTPTDLDLNTLTSQLTGGTLSCAEIVALFLYNAAGGANLLVGAGTNPVAMFADATDVEIVGAGGFLCKTFPAGLAVANSSSDILRLQSAGADLTVDIGILGRSA